MMRPLPIATCLALVLATVAFAASAQEPATAPGPASGTTTPSLAGDVERGRMLTYTCVGCHGVPGYKNAYPNYHVPRIGGQSRQYLVDALTGYQQGQREHPTMQAQAESFSEADIADIAAFLSSLKP